MRVGGYGTRFYGLTFTLCAAASLAACSEAAPHTGSHTARLNISRVVPWSTLGYRSPGKEYQAAGPTAVAVGPAGKIFVLDALRAQILEVGPSSLKRAAKVPETAEDLAIGDDGAFLVHSPLQARAWIFDAEGKPAGELRIPRTLRQIQSVSLGRSHQVVVHDAHQETMTLGSPAAVQTLPAILHSRREGAFALDQDKGVIALRNSEGRAEVRVVSARGERRPALKRFTLADEVLAVRVVGVAQGVICLRLEQSSTAAQEGALALQRSAVCLDAKTGNELLRAALPPPGQYMPRRELALGGDPLRLVQISAEENGLALRSWTIGGER